MALSQVNRRLGGYAVWTLSPKPRLGAASSHGVMRVAGATMRPATS